MPFKDPKADTKWHRNAAFKRKYGITFADYEQMFSAQNGLCAICQKQPSKKKWLSIDHNHQTGQVRALLCDKCNYHIGTLESPMFAAYQDYLARYKG